MRIVCPNCDAEYEVDSALIPETGRDVQCSSCGQVWFQPHPEIQAQIEAEETLFDPPPPEVAAPPAPADAEAAPPAPPPAAPATDPDPRDEDQDDDDDQGATPAAAPPRPVDDAVFAVLREEAEHEARQRRVEQPAVETQAELALAASRTTTGTALSEPRGTQTRTEAEPAPATAKRDMLPPIGEINSTLRSSTERRKGRAAPAEDDLPARSANGFWRGFSLAFLLFAILLTLYSKADSIAQVLPAAEPALSAYVTAIDAIRHQLNAMFGQLADLIRNAGA